MSVRTERLEAELPLVRKRYGDISVADDLSWLIVERFPVPAGWSATETSVLIQLPPGYPTAPPDNFGVDSELRLQGDRKPGNLMDETQVGGRRWLMFSWHAVGGTWRPTDDPITGDNLLTFLETVQTRLAEAS